MVCVMAREMQVCIFSLYYLLEMYFLHIYL